MDSSMSRRVLLALSMVAALGVSAGMTESAGAADDSSSSSAASLEAEPGVAPADDAGAVYLDMAGNVMAVDSYGSPIAETDSDALNITTTQEAATFGPCKPVSGVDYPHQSTARGWIDVSGHGWWEAKGNCSNLSARVYNCLYEWYSDRTWRQKDCSTKEVLRPGGGSGNRTNARRACANYRVTSWRNHVDVDVISEWDTADRPFEQRDVACRVY